MGQVFLVGSGGGTRLNALTNGATESVVLENYQFYDAAGNIVVGTMPNIGAFFETELAAGASVNLPLGYHNGQGRVSAKSLASQTGVDSGFTAAGAGQILTGYQAWVNGNKINGNMTNRGAVSTSIAAGATYTIPAGYHNGSGKVTSSALNGQTSGTAAASDVLKDKTAWVNGSQITGTMANRGTVSTSLNAGGSYTILAGYHNGNGKITANSLSSQTSGTASTAHILSGKTAWVNGSKLTGGMTDRGAWTSTANRNSSVTIPAGYHNGSGKVYGQKMTDKGAATITPGKTNQTIAAGTYLTGVQTILGDANLIANNIKSGVTIFGVAGNLVGGASKSAADLYNNGVNTDGFTSYSAHTNTTVSTNYVQFDATQITTKDTYSWQDFIIGTKKHSSVGYTKINIVYRLTASITNGHSFSGVWFTVGYNSTSTPPISYNGCTKIADRIKHQTNASANTDYTWSFNISSYQVNATWLIQWEAGEYINASDSYSIGKPLIIKRIYFS